MADALPVCPMYLSGQSKHFIWWMRLSLYLKNAVFWDVAPCGFINPHGASSGKTSNPTFRCICLLADVVLVFFVLCFAFLMIHLFGYPYIILRYFLFLFRCM
jgi:hypothetical protein